MRASVAWRAMIVFATLVALAGLVVGPLLFKANHDTAEANRSTICSIGSFLTSAPLLRVGGVEREDFVVQLVITRDFLRDLAGLDCPRDGVGQPVTAAAIERQLRRIHRELRRQREGIHREHVREAAARAARTSAGLPGLAGASSSPPTTTSASSSPSSGGSSAGAGGSSGSPGAGPGGSGAGGQGPGPGAGGPAPGGSEPGDSDDGAAEQVGHVADEAIENAGGLVCSIADPPALCPP